MKIGGLQKLTLIDYPGKIACTVFLIGCNFRCPFCYSSELVLPEKIKNQPIISEKDLFVFLKERQELLDGLVICGGEPTINKDLLEFAEKVKKLGYLIKLDTNGSCPEMIKKIIDRKLIDYIAMDIKAPLEKEKYEKAIGGKVNLNKIKKAVEIIKKSGIDYEFRTTVVPGIHSKKDIIQIAQELSPAKRFYLQSFRSEKTIDPRFNKVKPYSQQDLFEIKKSVFLFFDVCEIRG